MSSWCAPARIPLLLHIHSVSTPTCLRVWRGVRRPEGGQEVKQPALTFSKGDQIIVTNSEGVDVRTGFWEGYTAQEPDKMGFFPARCGAFP